MIVPLQNLHHAAADGFGIQSLERQEHDAELGRMRRRKVLIVNVLRLGFEGGDQLLDACVNLLARAFLVRVTERPVGVSRELGVNRQPDKAAVLNGQLDRVLDYIAAVRHGRHVGLVLLRRENILEDRTQLNLAHDTAGLDIGEHLLQITDTLC